MSEIKPCPFCGGDAEIKQTHAKQLYLKCVKCGIGIRQRVLRYSLDWLRGKMIDNWNRRVSQCEECHGVGEKEKTIGGNGYPEADVPVICSDCGGTGLQPTPKQ